MKCLKVGDIIELQSPYLHFVAGNRFEIVGFCLCTYGNVGVYIRKIGEIANYKSNDLRLFKLVENV